MADSIVYEAIGYAIRFVHTKLLILNFNSSIDRMLMLFDNWSKIFFVKFREKR